MAEAGVDRDWRALWTKMSGEIYYSSSCPIMIDEEYAVAGVVEPYVERMTEHLGSAINIALRQQNNRRVRLRIQFE